MKFWHLFVEASLGVLDNLFYLLSLFLPKNPDIWLFGSMFGNGYADNSKYFFEYICKYHPPIRAIWYSANADVVTSLRQQGYEAYRFYQLRGIVLALRARVALVSHSLVRDIRPFVFSDQVLLVNLWHGIPLKKIALDDKVSEVRNRPLLTPVAWLSRLLIPGFRRQPDLLTAASNEDQHNFSTAFALPINKIRITGYPRNDVLSGNWSDDSNRKIADDDLRAGIYVPTFRGKENSNFDFFDQFGFDVGKIDQRLAELGVKLYLKLHHFNYPGAEISRKISEASHIAFYEGLDVYADLSTFNFLITDFSSIYFDYLLTDKPIIFAPFDQAGYEGGVRQLYYDYAEVTPGPKAQNWPEVVDCIAGVFADPLQYAESLARVKARFQQYADGNNCRRVYDEVRTLL